MPEERTYAVQQNVNHRGLENESKGDPVQEAEQSLQRRLDQRGLLRLFQDLLAELEDLGELARHLVFQVFRLRLGHMLSREVEDLLGEQLQDNHVVLAEEKVGLGRLHEFWDKSWPIMRPLLLKDLE